MLESLVLAAATGPASVDPFFVASVPSQLVILALLASVSVATFLSMRARHEERQEMRDDVATPDEPAPAAGLVPPAWTIASGYLSDAAIRAASPAWAPRGQNRA